MSISMLFSPIITPPYSWRDGTITVTPNPTPVKQLAQELGAKLVKFKEVHFSSERTRTGINSSACSFDEDACRHLFFYERPPRFGNGINSAILRALPAALEREGSRLKSLTLDCNCVFNNTDLIEARKKLTVNIISKLWDQDANPLLFHFGI